MGARRGVWRAMRLVATALLTVGLVGPAAAVPYDIVYVRQPRFGDNDQHDLARGRSTRRASIPAPTSCCCIPTAARRCWSPAATARSPIRSSRSTAQWVYYSYFPDVRPQAYQLPARPAVRRRRHLPHPPRDARRSSSSRSASSRPTPAPAHFDEIEPGQPAGASTTASATASSTSARLRCAGGKIAFTSNRNGFMPPQGLHQPDAAALRHGRGRRQRDADRADEHRQRAASDAAARRPPACSARSRSRACATARMWGIWSIWPDGRHWEPVVSAFRDGAGVPLHDPARRTATSSSSTTTTSTTTASARSTACRSRPPAGHAARSTAPSPTTTRRSRRPSAAASSIRSACRSRRAACTRSRRSRTATTRRRRSAPAACASASSRIRRRRPSNDLLVVWTPGPGQRPQPPDHAARTTTPAST